MVHQLPGRHEGGVVPEQCPIMLPDESLRSELRISARYVLVPDSLIASFAHDPLTVGVYAAIARLTMAARTAVSLAARDLAAWMGSDRDADRAAIMRRIVKLEERGWLMVTRRTATKNSLLPTWGRDQTGVVRPWLLDQAASGRPDHMRGRRVPLELFDTYLGRLDPQPGHGGALISRYFTRPLLDLTDIGIYTIGLRAEVAPSPRLCHLGLQTAAGMLQPADCCALLAQANALQLTTDDGDMVVAVQLSVHGHARLNIATPTITPRTVGNDEHMFRSTHGSGAGSTGRSPRPSCGSAGFPHQDGQNVTRYPAPSLIAWDVGIGHERTNHDSTADPTLGHGGGAATTPDRSACETDALQIASSTPVGEPTRIEVELEQISSALADCVLEGHRALNCNRPILAGEWYELLALQEAHGAEQLLIWQARASRAAAARSFGITPSYYCACAARAACDAYAPRTADQAINPGADNLADDITSPKVALDPARDALLQAMGVRERQKLGAVPYDLIAAWQLALAHPGLATQVTSPVGFAVAQMQRGNRPPPITELERWAEQARRRNDRYEAWRYLEHPAATLEQAAKERQLEARVRALAPPSADLVDLCALARAIEAGASDTEALAQILHSGGGR